MSSLEFALWLSGYLLNSILNIQVSCARSRAHMSAQHMINYSRKCPGASALQIFQVRIPVGKTLLGGYRWEGVRRSTSSPSALYHHIPPSIYRHLTLP